MKFTKGEWNYINSPSGTISDTRHGILRNAKRFILRRFLSVQNGYKFLKTVWVLYIMIQKLSKMKGQFWKKLILLSVKIGNKHISNINQLGNTLV